LDGRSVMLLGWLKSGTSRSEWTTTGPERPPATVHHELLWVGPHGASGDIVLDQALIF